MPCQLAHPDRDLLLNRATQGPHTKRLLQHSRGRRSPPPLSRGVHPEVPEASDSTGSCVGTSGRCCAVWPSRARATWKKSICWSTPCPSGCRSPPKVLGRAGDRVHQGEERDPHRPALCRAAAQLRRAALLGPPKVLRVHGWSRRTGDSHIYPGPLLHGCVIIGVCVSVLAPPTHQSRSPPAPRLPSGS